MPWGTADEVAERIIAAADSAGANQVQLGLNRGAMPHEMFMEQIERFARDVLPALAWNTPPATFATAFVMSNVGVMVGALASGPTGDRLGRKPVILTSMLFLRVLLRHRLRRHDRDVGVPALHDRHRHRRAHAVHRRAGLRLRA